MGALGVLAALLSLVAIFAAPGSGDALYAFVTVLSALLTAGVLALLWILGAIGIGRAAAPLLRPIEDAPARVALQGVLGLAMALTLAHLLGGLALMNPWIAWAPTLAGLIALVHQARRSGAAPLSRVVRGRSPALVLSLLAIPPLALLCVAATVPPGTLWSSEARAYDVLSYHLMLPREWIDLGRIVPLTHNVYSFLPSYMEAAYAQLALMVGAGAGGAPPLGLGTGFPLEAAAFLHALLALGTALVIAIHVRRVVLVHVPPGPRPTGDLGERRAAGASGMIAAGAFIGVPWTIVVASLAYNEMGVTLCFAGALLATFERPLRPAFRAAIAAFLIGVACSIKPTAIYLVAPATAAALAFAIPVRRWVPAALACIPAGLAPLAPWLVRNWLASDNPVFPAATSIFSSAHWSQPQVDRWNVAHHADLSALDRLARLVDPSHGILHAQWSILFPLALLAGAIALAHRPTRTLALLSCAMLLIKAIAWLAIGHLQSRFLISAAVPASILAGLATFALARTARVPRVVAYGAPAAGVCVLLASSSSIFVMQNGGAPNAALLPGVPYMNGSVEASPPPLGSPGAPDFYGPRPVSFALNNLASISGRRATTVLLVGDATPLYLGRAPNRIIYATTWDTNPLAAALRESGGDAPAALRILQDRHAVTHLLVNFPELDRLETSGYLDPILAIDALLPLLRDHTRIVLRWDDRGVVLAAIPGGP